LVTATFRRNSREFGWDRFAVITRRRARIATVARSWEEMRTSITERLLRQTGHDVAWWNEHIASQSGACDEVSLRAWLGGQGVTGYQQMLLVHETFGYRRSCLPRPTS
jgi:hypothetical protein